MFEHSSKHIAYTCQKLPKDIQKQILYQNNYFIYVIVNLTNKAQRKYAYDQVW